MQKIMFNDKYGLTQSVLEGRKTMTRRIIDAPSNALYMKPVLDLCRNIIKVYALDPDGRVLGVFFPKYRVGEVVAVAQSYKDAGYHPSYIIDEFHPNIENEAGWSNKMFVRADLMPDRICITNIRYERLQDISDEDCLREGIYKQGARPGVPDVYAFDTCLDQYGNVLAKIWYTDPRDAFAALIDKVSGKGTWASNPFVWVYEFELVK